MDVSGDVADLLVKESIQLTEASIKMLAAGSKNLLAFLFALSRDNKKVSGKTKLGRLLKEGKELKVFRIRESDLKLFATDGKRYGALYAVVKDKTSNTGLVDLITNVDYVSQVNRMIERLGYPAPEQEQEADTPKKADPRVPRKSSSPERGSGLNTKPTRTETTPDKPSVKGRLAALRAASDGMSGKAPQHNRATPNKNKEKSL